MITSAAAAGASVFEIMEVSGHRSAITVTRYVDSMPKYKRSAYARMGLI